METELKIVTGMEEKSNLLPLSLTEDTKVDISVTGEVNPAFDFVKKGKLGELQNFLSSQSVDWVEKIDGDKKTVLHWAVVFGSRRIAKKMTIAIMKYPKGHKAKKNLADMQDNNGETALHLAAKSGRAKIVMELLNPEIGPDWNIRAGPDKGGHKTALDHIYAQVPEAIINQFNTAINYADEVRLEEDDSREIKICDEIVELNFGQIIGCRHDSNEEDKLKEANRLGGLMTDRAEKFTPILEHPLVQVFLHIKYQKAYIFILASIAAHILWQILYGYFLFNIYFNTCPWKHEKIENTSSSALESKMECDRSGLAFPGFPLAVGVWISGLIFLAKESFEWCTVPWGRYFTQLENLGQIFSIISVPLTCFPIYEFLAGTTINPVMVPWQYVLAAAAEFTAWALILGQVCKLLPLRIYIQIFVKVFKSFCMFITTFAALLLGFASAFCIMMPEAKAFKTPWLAVPKVLVMMTGELNYDDVFHGEEDAGAPSHYVTTQVLFSLFTIIMSLILLNLLIGLAVTDTQQLKENCHSSELSSMLEEVYLLESFAVRIKTVLGWGWLIDWLRIDNLSSNPQWIKKSENEKNPAEKKKPNHVTLEFSKASEYPFPMELMKKMRDLTEENLRKRERAAGFGSNLTLGSVDNKEDKLSKLIQLSTLLVQELQKL